MARLANSQLLHSERCRFSLPMQRISMQKLKEETLLERKKAIVEANNQIKT